ncbi:protein ImuB [Glaciihabitans tibetensis]|uniref:Protein ImuB n=1 Tax=Glaciihabitans tibetensis TaxID=1266600 RepID=A0A2T0VJW2_9MICO|nr:DNA polymerase Y family protein [Glaciihabitans tibetensis]PRY70479.1 protein ImuB [Glaciihabitans tibetensis]
MNAPIVRTMVLWCPDWPIIAALREAAAAQGLPTQGSTMQGSTALGSTVQGSRAQAAGRSDIPLALIEHGVVFACSAAARAEGVKRGLRVREAQARCPELVVQPYNAVHDNRAFEEVLTAIEAMMPGVQLLRPGTCAIRARGPARYYGGEKPSALALIALLDQLGVPGARVGIADGPFTAEQAARMAGLTTGRSARVQIVPEGASAEFLAPLPVSLLDAPALVTLLRRLGVTTLAEFAALPVVDVLGRFGEAGAHLHSLASGHDSRPVIQRIPPEELDSTVEFEPPLDRIDQVTFGVRASSDRFIEALTEAQLVCTALRIEIDSESGEVSERSWLHPRSFTAADVVDRVRWQLQGSGEVDTGLTSGITRVRVIPESVDAIGHHEVGLFGGGPDERIHHGLSRVQSMLGHGGVLTAVIGGGRTLADRQTTVPWGDRPLLTRQPTQPWPGTLPPPAPTTIFPTPHPVHVLDATGGTIQVDDRGTLSASPAQFSPTGSGRTMRQIQAWAGPWPIDERWWDNETHRRSHRFQVVDAAGMAWLLVLVSATQGSDSSWWAEARYD